MRIKLKTKGAETGRIQVAVPNESVKPHSNGPATFEDLPNEYDPFKHGVTYSLLNTFASCPEKFRLGYVERWTSVKTGKALDFGNVVHAALHAVYEAVGNHIRLGIDESKVGSFSLEELAKQVLTKHMAKSYTEDKGRLESNPTGNPNEFDELEETYGIAHVTLESYLENWIEKDSKLDWVALEKEITVAHALPDGRVIKIHMKLDGVFRSKGYWLKEVKTKGRVDELTLVDKMSYDFQPQLYLLGMEHTYGEAPAGVLYDVIRRSQLRQKKTERRIDFLKRIREDIEDRPEFYFIQNRIAFFPDELRRWRVELDRRINQFIYAWEQRNFYRESAACDIIGRTCPFICLCSGQPVRGLYTRSKTFSELESV